MSEEEMISEDWLKSVGFKWHQLERQPEKQWLLWLGDAIRERERDELGKNAGWGPSTEDVGIELSEGSFKGEVDGWFCWLRADTAHRYSRFLHVRHLRTRADLIRMIEGLTGQEWNPEHNMYGGMHGPKGAEYLRRESQRLDQQHLRMSNKWRDIEKDDTRGGALPEHMEDSIKNGTSK